MAKGYVRLTQPLVRDGDLIKIAIAGRSIQLVVSDAELAAREQAETAKGKLAAAYR